MIPSQKTKVLSEIHASKPQICCRSKLVPDTLKMLFVNVRTVVERTVNQSHFQSEFPYPDAEIPYFTFGDLSLLKL